jgi:hypothetical protein
MKFLKLIRQEKILNFAQKSVVIIINKLFSRSNNPNWKGGFDKNRFYASSEKECIKLNKKFKESHGHHITKSVLIYIPSYLHKMEHSLNYNGL